MKLLKPGLPRWLPRYLLTPRLSEDRGREKGRHIRHKLRQWPVPFSTHQSYGIDRYRGRSFSHPRTWFTTTSICSWDRSSIRQMSQSRRHHFGRRLWVVHHGTMDSGESLSLWSLRSSGARAQIREECGARCEVPGQTILRWRSERKEGCHLGGI